MGLSVAQIATVVHDFTMDDIDHFAKWAAGSSQAARLLDYTDRYDAAWHGIVVYLFECEERPERRLIIAAGQFAIQKESSGIKQLHGLPSSERGDGSRFVAYWGSSSRTHHTDFADAILERVALPQVLALLTDKQYEAVVALASFGNTAQAAAAIGIQASALVARLSAARSRIEEAWYAPEHPRTKTAKADLDRICRSGHLRETHSYRNGRQWVCRKCVSAAERRKRARDPEGAKKAARAYRDRQRASKLEAETQTLAEAN